MIRRHFHDVFYDGMSLGDYGVHVSGSGVFKTPQKSYDTEEVPGKHGSLLLGSGRYDNVSVTYPAFILEDDQNEFRDRMIHFSNFILSRDGYKRLEDTYHPDEYRLAIYKGSLDPEVILLQAGNFDLEFDCKPQRFLKSGEIPSEYTTSSKIYNPTQFDATPLLRIYGNGTVGLGENTIKITGSKLAYIDINCDLVDAYYGATNANSYCSFTIPVKKNNIVLTPGINGITLGSGIIKVIVWPRWWII